MTNRPAVVAVALLVLASSPVAGQDEPTEPAPQTVNRTTGFSILFPLTPGALSRGVRGFRLSHAWALNPALAIEMSALQVGGRDAILMGGGAGVRFSHYIGPIRFSPSAELVTGLRVIDEGGWYVDDGTGGTVYRPYRRPSGLPALGLGLMGRAEWLHRTGWGAELLFGYWRLARPAPASAMAVGLGVRHGRSDSEWYWRTSGRDKVPPRFQISSPDPGDDGARALGTEGLRIVAEDRSGIASIEVDGVPGKLTPAPPGIGSLSGADAAAVMTSIRPPIYRGRHALAVDVRDGAGNSASEVVWVTGTAPGPPTTVVTLPASGAALGSEYAEVTGFVTSATEGLRVAVNGCAAEVVPSQLLGRDGQAFKLRIPLDLGENQIEVETTDPLRGRTLTTQRVVRVPGISGAADRPQPDLSAWILPSDPGRAMRVQGIARDPGGIGIREVRVAGILAPIRFEAGTRLGGRFLAHVMPDSDQPIDVTMTTFDGRVSSMSLRRPGVDPEPLTGAALLIAVEAYAADHIAGPSGAAAAANAMASLLRERGAVEMPAERVRVLTDGAATEDAVREGLRWLAATAPHVDVVYLYLAGRGTENAFGRLAGLIPHDARTTYGPGSIRWVEIEEALRSSTDEGVILMELAGQDGEALLPTVEPPCGMGGLWPRAQAVLSAIGPADGSFSRRALEVLSGATVPGLASVQLSDLIRHLESGTESILRGTAPVFDPTLPLITLEPR